MSIDELLKVTRWAKIHDKVLTDLYNQFKEDTDDTKTSFTEFTFTMYDECHHGSLSNEKELPKPRTLH